MRARLRMVNLVSVSFLFPWLCSSISGRDWRSFSKPSLMSFILMRSLALAVRRRYLLSGGGLLLPLGCFGAAWRRATCTRFTRELRRRLYASLGSPDAVSGLLILALSLLLFRHLESSAAGDCEPLLSEVEALDAEASLLSSRLTEGLGISSPDTSMFV